MARPKKVQPIIVEDTAEEAVEMPVEAPVSPATVFYLQDPTSRLQKRILRVYSTEERDALIKRGWVNHG